MRARNNTTQRQSEQALRRREFFQRAFAAAAGVALTSLAPGCASLGARGSIRTPEDIAACKASEPFDGYCLMMYAYGDKTCHELFTTRLQQLIPDIRARILAAPTELISHGDALIIHDILKQVEECVPNAKVKQFYLLEPIAEREKARTLLQTIDPTLLPLPFAYQVATHVGDARDALHTSNDGSMITAKGCGNMTLLELYAAPVPRDGSGRADTSHSHVRAVTSAKKGFIFGPHYSQFAGNDREFTAFLQTYSGPIKNNDRACSGTSCVPCTNRFCGTSEGACTLMSDSSAGCTILPGT